MKLSQLVNNQLPNLPCTKCSWKRNLCLSLQERQKSVMLRTKNIIHCITGGKNKEIRSIIEWYIYVKANTSMSHLILCFWYTNIFGAILFGLLKQSVCDRVILLGASFLVASEFLPHFQVYNLISSKNRKKLELLSITECISWKLADRKEKLRPHEKLNVLWNLIIMTPCNFFFPFSFPFTLRVGLQIRPELSYLCEFSLLIS